MDPLTEAETLELLGRARRGDGDAWARLTRLHRETLVRVATLRFDRRLAARLGPEDLVQEAFSDAHRSLDDFFRDREAVSFSHWLRQRLYSRIARARRDHVSARMRSVEKEMVAPIDGDGPRWDHLPAFIDPGSRPSHNLTREEAQRLVREALLTLEPTDREVLTLYFYEGYDRDAVSEVLGIGANAVSARLLRATKHLASAMKRANPDWCHAAYPRDYRSA